MSTDLEEGLFSRDATLARKGEPELTVIDGDLADAPPASRLDVLEHHIEDEAAQEAIEEQIEEIEGEVEEPASYEPADQPTDHSGFTTGIETRVLNATTPAELDTIAEDIGAADFLPEAETERLDALLAKKRRALK